VLSPPIQKSPSFSGISKNNSEPPSSISPLHSSPIRRTSFFVNNDEFLLPGVLSATAKSTESLFPSGNNNSSSFNSALSSGSSTDEPIRNDGPLSPTDTHTHIITSDFSFGKGGSLKNEMCAPFPEINISVPRYASASSENFQCNSDDIKF
jgi:hypothetical protein